MTATDTLRAEHQGIERVIAVLEAALSRLEANQDVPAEIFKQVVDFFHGFVDTCHHSKEEIELFPTLERHGIPRQGGPIGVMLYEHEQGRRTSSGPLIPRDFMCCSCTNGRWE